MTQAHFPGGERPVHRALSAAVDQYFRDQQTARSGNGRLYRKAFIILTLFCTSFVAMLTVTGELNWLAWLIHGAATALVGFNIMHDGAHQSFSRSRRLNQLAALTFNLIGSNRYYWAQKHNRNHHSFTNVDDVDEDIDALGLFRMSPRQKHYGFHRAQHLYVWFLYPLTSLFWFFVLDYKAWLRQKIGERDFSHRMKASDHAEFLLSKVLYVLIYLVLPLQLLSTEQVVVGFLLMHAILGVLFAVVFQLAHVVDQAEFLQPDDKGVMHDEWAVHQLRTTVDFAPQSRFLTWALGGLNFQVEHHLFPRVSHVHYPALHAILTQQCAALGQPVRSYATLWQALAAHYRHLKSMGRPD
ncbi:fatty acid desaturase family protein [Thalassolituus sp. LLYu03]|uniref:fatty acid desaturase family protein n=1 Tax=Thalassolituus sp. LLYu03 TaxID=3421656 RepID=UPI003D2B59F6